jgi:hypothetical protein
MSKFSHNFESIFRIFAILWISGWLFFNGLKLILQYTDFFMRDYSGGQLGLWWIQTTSNVVSIGLGATLLAFTITARGVIERAKKFTNLNLMMAILPFYYLFVTVINIFANYVLKPDGFDKYFTFQTAWLFPSIIMLVFHVFYIYNLGKYNEQDGLKD